ncbi:MAG: polyphenol oxidase family protein, partial [Deltaproteobacteria bacterium]|nr:polyphenol oxidase family protein [Deltaproteobacteria bacterium]
VAGVLPAAVRALLALDVRSRPGDLLVAVGPHIRVAAFEVGEDVAAQIAAAAPTGVPLPRPLIERRGSRRYANLAALLHAQMQDLGVQLRHIEDVGGCTFSEPERFFSHRRDDGRTGRQLGVIQPRG